MGDTPPVDGSIQANQGYRAPIAERSVLLQQQPAAFIPLRLPVLPSIDRCNFHATPPR